MGSEMCIRDRNKALKEICDVLLQDAGYRGIHLGIKLPNTSQMIDISPLGFQVAVLYGVEQIIDGMKQGDRVDLEAEVREGRFQVSIIGPYPDCSLHLPMEKPATGGLYREIVEELGGQILKQPVQGKSTVILAFPLACGKK